MPLSLVDYRAFCRTGKQGIVLARALSACCRRRCLGLMERERRSGALRASKDARSAWVDFAKAHIQRFGKVALREKARWQRRENGSRERKLKYLRTSRTKGKWWEFGVERSGPIEGERCGLFGISAFERGARKAKWRFIGLNMLMMETASMLMCGLPRTAE